MTFFLGKRSRDRLQGVKPELYNCIILALTSSDIDFTVIQGLRTEEEQHQNVASGASQTMKSKHLTGDAVDLAAWIDGKLSYDEHWFYDIAEAMKYAANAMKIEVIWGAVWDRKMSEYDDVIKEVQRYKARRMALGKKAFLDLGHWELA